MDVLNFLNFLAGIVSCGISIFLAIFTPRMKKKLENSLSAYKKRINYFPNRKDILASLEKANGELSQENIDNRRNTILNELDQTLSNCESWHPLKEASSVANTMRKMIHDVLTQKKPFSYAEISSDMHKLITFCSEEDFYYEQ